MFPISVLWTAPEVNPINRKARSIPIFNVLDPYGRVFFFSWWGFFIAFWSWVSSLGRVLLRSTDHFRSTRSLH